MRVTYDTSNGRVTGEISYWTFKGNSAEERRDRNLF